MRIQPRHCILPGLLGGLASLLANPVFVDVTEQAGLQRVHGNSLAGERIMTGGAASIDFDGDGWPDLAVTRYGGHPTLYRNRGDGTFEELPETIGILMPDGSNGAGWADIDNDGDPDLYLTQSDRRSGADHRHRLFINDGAGGFTEEAAARGAALDPRAKFGTSVAFGDYDLDGWLDIHLCEWGFATNALPGMTRLLRNRGATSPGFFDDRTTQAGVSIDGTVGFGYVVGDMPGHWAFSSRFTDLDGDGLPDLVLACDFGTSRLFWNNGGGVFADGTDAAMVGTDENGMGLTVADYDGDGRRDIFITSIFHTDPPLVGENEGDNWGTSGNRLFRNLGGRVFEDATTAAGVRDGAWGWGASFGDFDNDGWLDLVMTNGYTLDPLFEDDQSKFFRNKGDGTFEDISDAAGVTDTLSGKGLLTLDFDRDGDLDIFICNNSAEPVLYRNDQTTPNRWLKLRLEGTVSNRDAIGAKVVARLPGGRELHREVDGGSNYLAQNDRVVHLGLGAAGDTLPDLTVHWPGGGTQNFTDVPVDAEYWIVETQDPRPVPTMLDIGATDELTAFELTWSARPGRRYQIQVSTDGIDWQALTEGGDVVALGNQITATVPEAEAGAALYRVVELAE